MKNAFKWILVFIILFISWICAMAYASLEGMSWFHILLLIGTWFMIFPAVLWWKDYLDKRFMCKKCNKENII